MHSLDSNPLYSRRTNFHSEGNFFLSFPFWQEYKRTSSSLREESMENGFAVENAWARETKGKGKNVEKIVKFYISVSARQSIPGPNSCNFYIILFRIACAFFLRFGTKWMGHFLLPYFCFL